MVRLQCRVRPPLVIQQTNLQVQLEEISLVVGNMLYDYVFNTFHEARFNFFVQVRPGQMDQQQDLQQPMALVDLIGLQPTPPQFKRCWTRTQA